MRGYEQMSFEQGGVQGPAPQMIFDGGGLHFGRGWTTTARGPHADRKTAKSGQIASAHFSNHIKLAWTITVLCSCCIIAVCQTVLEEYSRVYEPQTTKILRFDTFLPCIPCKRWGGLALRQESNEQGGL